MTHETLPSFDSVFGVHVYANNDEPFKNGKWTVEEDEAFREAIDKFGIDNVYAIQAMVKTRTKVQIRNRVQKVKQKQEHLEYEKRVRLQNKNKTNNNT